jgi:hypothetical protein
VNIVALLDSMWGWGGYNEDGEEAPAYFRINPNNFSGRRLYQLCGSHKLLVTNSCRMVQSHANSHGTPNPEWVCRNLEFLKGKGMHLLLVCGTVAKKTYAQTSFEFTRVLYIDHPAARRWSSASITATAAQIERILQNAGAK